MSRWTLILVVAMGWACGDGKTTGPTGGDPGGGGDPAGGDTVVDTTPPGMPIIDPVTSPTTAPQQVLSGTAEPSSSISVIGGAAEATAVADAVGGVFNALVQLNTQTTTILFVTATDAAGNSSPAAIVTIVHQATLPDAPMLSPVASPTRAITQTIAGTTSEGDVPVVITGGAMPATGNADGFGVFAIPVTLRANATNALMVYYTASNGVRSAPAQAEIVHDNIAPPNPSVAAIASPTPTASVSVTGTAEPGTTVEVSGGANLATGTADSSTGAFDISVTLNANAINSLQVTATDDANNTSAPSRVLVEHDSMPPSAPVVYRPSSPTNQATQAIAGLTEPGATIAITGGLTAANSTADPQTGEFSVVVTLVADSPNTLSVTATDLAGNTGPAANVLVTHDTNAADAPIVTPVESPTAQNTITLTGTTSADADISVVGGASAASTTADSNGVFSVDVDLRANATNELIVTANAGGNPSSPTVLTVIHDDTAPAPPSVTAIDSPTALLRVLVTGTAEAQARVTVNGASAPATVQASPTGQFAVEITLTPDSVNHLQVTATDLAGNTSAASAMDVEQDSTPPPVVSLDAVPGSVSSPTVALTGTAEPNATVHATGGAADAQTVAGGDGSFSLTVSLNANADNTLTVWQVDGVGRSGPSTQVTVIHDSAPPDAPTLNPFPDVTNQATVVLTGYAEPGVAVNVTGGAAPASTTADGTGFFSVEVTLTPDTTNNLSVTATDTAGNTGAAASAAVTHDASAPDAVTLDPLPTHTSAATVTVSGNTDANATVTVTVNGNDQVVTADGSGDFSVAVTLAANSNNTITVVAEDTVGNPSTPVTVIVVHDDEAPSAPQLDSITSPSNLSPITVTGSAEPGVTVRVSGGAADVETTASGGGLFSVDVNLNVNVLNTLSVVAEDAAGNTSTAVPATVLHDNLAPGTPSLDAPTTPTNQSTIVITGTAEAGVLVRISGASAPVEVRADSATGAFSAQVTLSSNTTNALSAVAEDDAGNASAPATTDVVHDNVPPERLLVVPTRWGGSVGQPPVFSVSMLFSEPLDPATVTATTYQFQACENMWGECQAASSVVTVPATLTASTDGTAFSYLLTDVSDQFTSSMRYLVEMLEWNSMGIRDLAGNRCVTCGGTGGPGGGDVEYRWDIESWLEITGGPTVTASFPAAGSSGVPTNTPIWVQFDWQQEIDLVSVADGNLRVETGGQPVGLSLSSQDGRTFALVLDEWLQPSTAYTIVADTAIESVYGNALESAPVTIQFTTGAGPDTTGPSVVAADPFDTSTTDIAQDVQIDFTLSEPVTGFTSTAVYAWDESLGAAYSGAVWLQWDDHSLGFASFQECGMWGCYGTLPGGRSLELMVETTVTDPYANPLDQDPGTAGLQRYEVSFQTAADTTLPTVAYINPDSGTPLMAGWWVEAAFSEGVQVSTLDVDQNCYFTSVSGAAFSSGDPCANATIRNVWSTGSSGLADAVQFDYMGTTSSTGVCCLRITTDVLDVSGNGFDDDGTGPATDYEQCWSTM